MRKLFLLISFVGISFSNVKADSITYEQKLRMTYYAFVDSVQHALVYEEGEIDLLDSVATLVTPKGFKFLNGAQSEFVLEDLWKNPPSEPGYESLGMLFPNEAGPFKEKSYAVNITYAQNGHIVAPDASSIIVDELYQLMQQDIQQNNRLRAQQNYEKIKLVDWAQEPVYIIDKHLLYWAKEIQFGNEKVHSLNYNIRILGRRGYLRLNIIGNMDNLQSIDSHLEDILSCIEFKEGQRYEDYNSESDQLSPYTLKGLIIGRAVSKGGFTAVLTKAWWVLLLGSIAGFLVFRYAKL